MYNKSSGFLNKIILLKDYNQPYSWLCTISLQTYIHMFCDIVTRDPFRYANFYEELALSMHDIRPLEAI